MLTEGEIPPIRMVCTNANPADVLTEPKKKAAFAEENDVPV